MAFNTKVDVADTELEENEAVVAEAEDVTLEDETLRSRPESAVTRTRMMRKQTSPRTR